MKALWILLLSFALSAGGPTGAIAAPAAGFADQVSENAFSIALGPDGELVGPGAELIERESGKAQFFMVGEQHATDSIGKVNLGLHRLAARQGYGHAALEIGPHSTVEVERLARAGPGKLAGFIRSPGNSFVFPFLGWAEEVALVEQMIALSPEPAPVLWGLDQEFVGSAPLHVARLRAVARTADQKRLLADLSAKAEDPFFVAKLEPATYERLRAAFPADENSHAAALIEDLAISSRIYGPFVGRGGSRQAANADRETYLKRQFLEHFARAERATGKAPKVFFKFGANHAMRGYSLSDVPALGNFLAEWGIARGITMLNVLVDCVGGEQSDPRTGKRSPCRPYFDLPSESRFRAPSQSRSLTLFDLRPLRSAMPKDIDPVTKRMILGFDFYVPVHNAAPATLVAPVSDTSSKGAGGR